MHTKKLCPLQFSSLFLSWHEISKKIMHGARKEDWKHKYFGAIQDPVHANLQIIKTLIIFCVIFQNDKIGRKNEKNV